MRHGILSVICLGVVLFGCGLSVATTQSQDPPYLNLWVTGPATAVPGQSITLEVHRANSGFGLGGLDYTLQFSEEMSVTYREYSDYNWMTKDGTFDNCDPFDGSVSGSFGSLFFDTVVNPDGSVMAATTDEIVEKITLTLPSATTDQWIYFDLEDYGASDGVGTKWKDLGGTINVLPDSRSYVNPHEYGVRIPEPMTLTMLAVGMGIISRIRRRVTA